MPTETKRPWESRTMVLNGVMGLVAFVGLFWPGSSIVGDFLTAHGGEITMVWSVLNIVLRAVTKDKIVLRD